MAFVSIQNAPPDLILLDIQMPESDESKIRQILMNLLDNVIQLTEAGNVLVHVDVKERVISPTNSACRLILEVQSTGIGLASNELDVAKANSGDPHFPGDNLRSLDS
jgi:signal transduction histidine kinase